MPTLRELKDMLQKAESDVEAGVESLFGEEPQSEPEPASEAAEPVFAAERAHGIVDGIQGVKYQQDGEYFDSQRKFVRKA